MYVELLKRIIQRDDANDDSPASESESTVVKGGLQMQNWVASLSPVTVFWLSGLCLLFFLYIVLDILWNTWKTCRTNSHEYTDVESHFQPQMSALYDPSPSAADVALPSELRPHVRGPPSISRKLTLFRNTGRHGNGEKKVVGWGGEEVIGRVCPLDAPARKISTLSSTMSSLPSSIEEQEEEFETDRLILPGSAPDSGHLHTSEIGISGEPPRIYSPPPQSGISGWFASTTKLGEAYAASQVASIQEWSADTWNTSMGLTSLTRKKKISNGSRTESGLKKLIIGTSESEKVVRTSGTTDVQGKGGTDEENKFLKGQEI